MTLTVIRSSADLSHSSKRRFPHKRSQVRATRTGCPTLDIAYESTPEVTPEIQSESEKEATEMQTEQSKHVSRKRSWLVDVIDDEGKKSKKQLTVNDAWFLSSSEKILVNWNSEDQPIDNAGALLNRFLGHVARNMNIFRISYQSWRKIPKDYKEDVLKNTIQVKFEVDSDARVKYIFKSLNTKWSECIQQLWQQRDDRTRNRDDLIAMGSEGVNKDHWASFVDYRLSSRTKEISKKNKENRKRQTVPHTGGSKSIACKKDEMEQELGRKVSRGEVWIATHKHTNGDLVNDEAREISEKIQTYKSNTSSLSQDISTQDSLAHALGSQEHCGCVRGMGLGPCPSRVFGYTRHSSSVMSSSSPSYRELQNQVNALQSQLDEQNRTLIEQRKRFEERDRRFEAMMNFFAQNYQDHLPSNLAMFNNSPVSDQGSVPRNGTNSQRQEGCD
ncbi:hypothetical protein Fmac_008321 [Flemingia macrophylla]|uniref:Transposase n=1 Tax=Flemingia macrophylla TaxID=520843 RepID=A0ABD1MXL6_9FABA